MLLTLSFAWESVMSRLQRTNLSKVLSQNLR